MPPRLYQVRSLSQIPCLGVTRLCDLYFAPLPLVRDPGHFPINAGLIQSLPFVRGAIRNATAK